MIFFLGYKFDLNLIRAKEQKKLYENFSKNVWTVHSVCGAVDGRNFMPIGEKSKSQQFFQILHLLIVHSGIVVY